MRASPSRTPGERHRAHFLSLSTNSLMGDSGFSASELRKRYAAGGSNTDDSLSASQLRARYDPAAPAFFPRLAALSREGRSAAGGARAAEYILGSRWKRLRGCSRARANVAASIATSPCAPLTDAVPRALVAGHAPAQTRNQRQQPGLGNDGAAGRPPGQCRRLPHRQRRTRPRRARLLFLCMMGACIRPCVWPSGTTARRLCRAGLPMNNFFVIPYRVALPAG